jgi:hypothetical protein
LSSSPVLLLLVSVAVLLVTACLRLDDYEE